MRTLLISTMFMICAFSFRGSAQINYVLNGSFEDFRRCPVTRAQICYANGWHSLDSLWDFDTSTAPLPTDVPAFFSRCGMPINGSLPLNSNFYFHETRTGDGMVQLLVAARDNDTIPSMHINMHRQHAQGHLRQALTAGKQYCITFYISLEQLSRYASNMIGAYLDGGTIDSVQWPRQGYIPSTRVTPQVYDTTIFTDTLHWHAIQGSFIATGTERFITIANFFDNAHTDTLPNFIPTPLYPAGGGDLFYGYYLLDDVSVIATDAIADAGRDTSLSGETHDSAWIGNHDGYVPCRWYRITASGEVLIDSNVGGFMVKPTATTSYIMELEVCGHVTRDTVVITVAPVSVGSLQLAFGSLRVYPDPAADELTLEVDPSFANATAGEAREVVVCDMLGRTVKREQLSFSDRKARLSLSGLSPGTYTLNLQDANGAQYHVRFVKE